MLKVLKIPVLVAFFLSCQTQQADNANKSVQVYVEKPFVQEYHVGWVISKEDKAANEVRAVLPATNGYAWVATKAGVFMKKPQSHEWELMIGGESQGPAYDIIEVPNGKVWIGAWDGVYVGDEMGVKTLDGPEPPIAKLLRTKDGVYALGPKGIWKFTENSWKKKHYHEPPRSIRDAVSDGGGGVWIASDVGLFHCTDERTTVYRDTTELISAYLKGLDYDAAGRLWAGGLGGVAIRESGIKKEEIRPQDGLPHAQVTAVKKAPDGRMWIGTEYGISRFRPGEPDYSVRLSRRWQMNDHVRDIEFDKDGNAWIATAGGVSVIKRRELTLAQKADYLYDFLIRRHVREPWIVNRFRLEVPGDTTTLVPDDDDNDGEYTSNYLAMEAFRYAATKDPLARERARKAYDFLAFLQTVTGTDGFFARTIVPASWERMHDPNRTYTPQELADELIRNPRHKPVEVRWRLSKDGEWKWKGDTSSDELDGHLFAYFCYYTLVADEEEKKAVARHFSKIMDHLMRNNYNLTDLDGKHTKWGVWSPEQLNHDPEWVPEKALNSMELLAFLKFAHHITGDEKYQEAYLHLIEEEGYLENAKALKNPNPAFDTYFDTYLELYVFFPLISHENDPALKKEYKDLLNHWFQKNRVHHSPFVNFAYNYLTGGSDALDNSVAFLIDAPIDLVNWRIDNGKREDLSIVRKPMLEELQINKLLPPSELRAIRWDRNFYQAVAGNPSEEYDPVYWLLPYWMGRYLGLIKDAE